MSKFDWKQSERTTCPKCGSEDFKELSKKQEALMGIGGVMIFLLFSLLIPTIFIPFLIVALIFGPLIYFFPHVFLGKKVLRKCNRCRKQWKAFPAQQKAEVN